MNKYLVVVGFQGVWFISVLGAAQGMFWPGPLSALCWVFFYARKSRSMKRELLLAFCAGFTGLCVDTLLIWSGAFSPKGIFPSLQISPAWMIGLWLNFSTSLNSLFEWLKGRFVLSALCGCCGGPAAYYSGVSLGAAAMGEPLNLSLAMIGIAWGASMPLLVWIAEKIR